MPITVSERFKSRRTRGGKSPSSTLLYILTGSDDEAALVAALETAAEPLIEGMTPQTFDVNQMGNELWEGTVQYNRNSPDTGDYFLQFDTSGASEHITQSRYSWNYPRPGETAPVFFNAIGVTKDSVEGIDVIVPQFAFSEVHYIADANINADAYYALTGSCNLFPFRGYAIGELLFKGASGRMRTEVGDWEITFHFAASPNRNGIAIGDITGIPKGGWEYLWVQYLEEEDSAAGQLVKRPTSVHVETVYPLLNFADLGI